MCSIVSHLARELGTLRNTWATKWNRPPFGELSAGARVCPHRNMVARLFGNVEGGTLMTGRFTVCTMVINPLSCHPRRTVSLSPNPPKDTDGRREDSGRGWVRELQGRWPGVGVDGRAVEGLQSPHRAPRPYAGVAMRGMARGYAAGDSRDRGGARLRGR